MFPLWNFHILIRRDIMSTTRIRAIMAELPSTVDGPKLLELVLEAALLLLEPLPKEELAVRDIPDDHRQHENQGLHRGPPHRESLG